MNRAQKILLAGELILIGATVACVRPEPQAIDTSEPEEQPGEAAPGDGVIQLPNAAEPAQPEIVVTAATEEPLEAEPTEAPYYETTNYIRNAIPTTVTVLGFETNRMFVSDIAASQLLSFAEYIAGYNVFTEDGSGGLEGALPVLRSTSNLPVTVRFNNTDLINKTIEDLEIPFAEASTEAVQDVYENAVVISVPVSAGTSDLEVNFQTATQLFIAVLETNVEDGARNEKLSRHMAESLGLAYACAKKGMSYEDYSKWYRIGAQQAGITDGSQIAVTAATYTELGYMPAIITLTP